MSAADIRRMFGVDIKRGERITVDGKPGEVVGFLGQYLGVRFDGEKHSRRVHPTWRVERQEAEKAGFVCCCGAMRVPAGELSVIDADTVHRHGGPCYVVDSERQEAEK